MTTFDENKYKKTFEQRYGSGSFDAGLADARKIGQLKAQAEIAKKQYSERKKASKNKSYNDALGAFGKTAVNEDTEKQLQDMIANPKKEGASRNAEKIKNNPALQEAIKSRGWTQKEFIDAMYNAASNGQFHSEREFNGFADKLKKDVKKRESDPYAKYGIGKTPATSKKEKDNSKGLDKLKSLGKDTDGDGERNGLLGVLDRTLGRASRAAQKTVFGEDFVKKQDEAYSKVRENSKNKEALTQMQKTITRKPQGALEKGSDIAGAVIGEIGPYAAGYGVADKSLKVAKGLNAIKNPIAREFARGGIAGAAVGTGKAAVRDSFSDDYGAKDYAKQIGTEALVGGASDAALSAIFKIVKGARGATKQATKKTDEVLGLPAPSQPLALPAPQLRLNAPLSQRLEQAGLNFAQNTKNIPKARINSIQTKPLIDPLNRNQQYWQGRYESFAKQINDKYDMNKMTPEALDDLWGQYAGYDEPVRLEQAIDLAYPQGFDSTPKIEPVNVPKQGPSLEPLQFRRLAGGMERQFIPNNTNFPKGWSKQDIKNSPVMGGEPFLERLKNLNAQPTTNQPLLDPLQKIKNQQVTPNQNVLGPLQKLRAQPSQTGGTVETFRSKVNRTPVKSSKLKDFAANFRTQFVDDLSPLEKLEKNIRGKLNSAEDSLYKQSRLYRGSTEKANQIFETQLSPILKSIEKEGFSVEDLGDYALAVHANDVNAKGINSGFTNDEIKAVIDKYNNPAMETARQQLMDLNDSLLNNLAESGVISKQSMEQMRKKYPNYMPLFRSFDDEKVDFATGISKILSVGSSPIKRLEGSSRDVIDPIESVVKNIFQLTSTADRNKVARQLGTLAKEDAAGNFVRQLNPGEEVGRKNVISAMENGVKVQYEVPPEVYKAMKNMDKESSSMLIKILQKPASTLRAGATLTPEFSLRNPMRDVVQAYVVSNSGFNPIVDFPVGLFQSALKGRTFKIAGKEFKAPDQLYRQFLQDNGGLGNIVSIDRDMHRKAIEDVLKSNDNRFINVIDPRSWVNVLHAIADVSESATKVGEYRAALRSGASRQEAAYRARDIMDFARAGASIREANKVVAFLNANIQGKSKLIRAVQENPWKVTVNSLKAVTLPTIGAFMAQQYLASDEQKKIIDDAPSWLKKSFWLVPVPGTEQIARIPKPFDIAPIFANLPEETLDYLVKNDPEAFDKFARETISSYTIPTMMTGLIPIVEGMANYSFFREGPIIPRREEGLNYPDQYDINTSETAKALGKGINALTQGEGVFKNFGSPRIVDNTIRGFTGGLGTYATDAVDLIVEGTGIVNEVEKPKKDFLTEQTPLRAFLMNQNSTGASVDKLYTLKDKLSRERGSSKLREGKYANEGVYKAVDDVTKDVSEISKVIRQIENDPNMSAEQKRVEIDRLNKLRNEIAFKTLSNLRQYLK